MSCQVNLLAYTPQPDRTVAAAARLCYSAVSATDLFEKSGGGDIAAFITNLRKSGHLSTFEHVSFTFAVDGISRICSHQLVRHRMASYSQQSQRYVSMEKPEYVVPHSIASSSEANELFALYCHHAHELYMNLISMGIPKEDARYILPHGWKTRITITMNARELHHFFALRTCRRAQWEIRELAGKMLREVRKVAPLLFAVAGPSCLTDGKCMEARSCKQPFTDIEELFDE
jgi:thymidylate synthase (FAD)